VDEYGSVPLHEFPLPRRTQERSGPIPAAVGPDIEQAPALASPRYAPPPALKAHSLPNSSGATDSNFRMAQYRPELHQQGDAATFLYKLVFSDGNNTPDPETDPEVSSDSEDYGEGNARSNVAVGSGHDRKGRTRINLDDDKHLDDSDTTESRSDSSSDSIKIRVRRRDPIAPPPLQPTSRLHGPRDARASPSPSIPQRFGVGPEPAVVINRLLLEWTQLTPGEIQESSLNQAADPAGDGTRRDQEIRAKLSQIVRESIDRDEPYEQYRFEVRFFF
jgi:hypothetical protein